MQKSIEHLDDDDICVKRCLVCTKVYEYRETHSIEVYVDMCRKCDSILKKKLIQQANTDDIVILHDGIWRLFNYNFWK
jgi:hypothetical protein